MAGMGALLTPRDFLEIGPRSAGALRCQGFENAMVEGLIGAAPDPTSRRIGAQAALST
jgi:hypothetical protein